MLDDAREAFGAALKWRGHSLNTTRPAPAAAAATTSSSSRSRSCGPTTRRTSRTSLLSGRRLARPGLERPVRQGDGPGPGHRLRGPEGGLDALHRQPGRPAGAPHPELAHAFIDFTLEAEVAAEICRTMRYSSPNRAAWPLLPPEVRDNPAIFPPPEVARAARAHPGPRRGDGALRPALDRGQVRVGGGLWPSAELQSS